MVEDIVQQLRTSGGSNSITAETEWIVKCFKGHTLMEQQEHENAISIFEELLQTFHNSTYIRSALAKTHYNALQYDQSKKFYEDLRSNDPYITDSLGWALFKLKRYKEAKDYLQVAVRLMPGDPIVNDHYGDVLWKNGNELQARYYWNYVLNLEKTEKDLKKIIDIKLIKGL